MRLTGIAVVPSEFSVINPRLVIAPSIYPYTFDLEQKEKEKYGHGFRFRQLPDLKYRFSDENRGTRLLTNPDVREAVIKFSRGLQRGDTNARESDVVALFWGL